MIHAGHHWWKATAFHAKNLKGFRKLESFSCLPLFWRKNQSCVQKNDAHLDDRVAKKGINDGGGRRFILPRALLKDKIALSKQKKIHTSMLQESLPLLSQTFLSLSTMHIFHHHTFARKKPFLQRCNTWVWRKKYLILVRIIRPRGHNCEKSTQKWWWNNAFKASFLLVCSILAENGQGQDWIKWW